MKKVVFAGTFDPFTVGHEDTVKKCLLIFDEAVVAVAENKSKKTMFSSEERAEMIRAVYKDEPRVKVRVWDGVIADLLKEENTPFYARGVRNAVDCAYETEDFYASRDLSPEMIALFLPAEQRHLHISSTLVKNCIAFGKSADNYVPAAVREYLGRKNRV